MPGRKLKRRGTKSRTITGKKKDKLASSAKALGTALASEKHPKASPQEDHLAGLLTEAGLAGFKRQLQFHEKRRWRFDFSWPDIMLALEYDGITGCPRSRHTTVKGFTNDCEKLNEAAILGWMVIRVTAPLMRSGVGMDQIERAFHERTSQMSCD